MGVNAAGERAFDSAAGAATVVKDGAVGEGEPGVEAAPGDCCVGGASVGVCGGAV